MELENVLPGPARLLLVLPTEETVAKALRFDLAVWVIAQPHRHSAAWLRDTVRLAEIVPVEGRDVATLAADVAQRHAVNYVLPTEFAVADADAGWLPDDITAIRACRQGPWQVEEYLTDSRFMVSTLTVDGMHHVVGISAWRQPGNAVAADTGVDGPARGWLHPAPLSARDRAALVATATGLLDLADYEFGPAQFDVVLTGQGVRVVTARPRFAGPGILRLIELTTGFDPEIALLGALASEPIVPPVAHRYAAAEFLPFSPELVRSAYESAEIADLPGVRELHLPTAPDDLARPGQPGFLVVCGASAADVERDTERARRRLHAALHAF